MNSQSISSRLKLLSSRKEAEGAFSIAEALIASVIIMIILVATASGFSSSFRSSASVENNNKAVQLANEVQAIARQSNYRDLWVASQTPTNELFGTGKCENQSNTPAGTTRVTSGENNSPFKGLVYCKSKRFGGGEGVGTTFYVQTQISYLKTSAAYDSGSDNANNSIVNGSFYSKRVYVTVRWQDVAAGEDKWSTVKTSYTRSPDSSDCLPDRISNTGKNADGSALKVPGCTPS